MHIGEKDICRNYDMGGRTQIFVLIPEVVQFGNIIDATVIDGAKGVHFPLY